MAGVSDGPVVLPAPQREQVTGLTVLFNLQAGTPDPRVKAAVLLRGPQTPTALMVWLSLAYTE